jgi:hypothetical protein
MHSGEHFAPGGKRGCINVTWRDSARDLIRIQESIDRQPLR